MAWALRPHGVRTRGKRNCDKLQTVDISRTEINEILGGTFARCSQLQHLKFAKTLRRIEREAFLRCTSLEEIHTPPALLSSTSELLRVVHSYASSYEWARKERGGALMLNMMLSRRALSWHPLPGFGFSPSATL